MKIFNILHYLSILVVILTHIWILTEKNMPDMMKYHAYINLVAGGVIAAKLFI